MATIRGGGKLELALSRIARQLSNASTLRVGFLENSSYPDGKPVAMIAAVNEFGAPSRGVPPRPFFRNMIAAKSEEWPDGIAAALKANDLDAGKALDLTGHAIKGQLQESIVDFDSVPLKPATVERKGNDKQLVDTGHMLNSVDFEVKS